MQIFNLILVFSVTFFNYSTDAKKSPTSTRGHLKFIPKEAGLCANHPPSVFTEWVRLYSEGAMIYVSAKGTVTRESKWFNKVLIYIRKCSDAARVEGCELFQTWRFGKETCEKLEDKHALWSPIFQNFHPALHCPIKKGNYTLEKAAIDASIVEALATGMNWEKYFWRVRIEVYEPGDTMFICLRFSGSFQRSRVQTPNRP